MFKLNAKSTAETPEQAHQRAKEAYQALIDYCKASGDDINAVAQMFKLNAKSTADEFDKALGELKRRAMLQAMKEGKE